MAFLTNVNSSAFTAEEKQLLEGDTLSTTEEERALITGSTDQDGSCLTDSLFASGYEVTKFSGEPNNRSSGKW
jgi:hypothetical protein